MVITVLAAIFLAKIKHYKIKYLFDSWSIYPVILVQLIAVFFQFSVFFGTYYFVRFSEILEPAVIFSFMFGMFVYRLFKPAIAGSCCIFAGTALNQFVIVQNGGKMPVFPSLSYLTGYTEIQAFGAVDSLHVLGNEETKFKFLTDYIDIGYSILSPGDVLIHLFVLIMLYHMVKSANMRYGTMDVRMI